MSILKINGNRPLIGDIRVSGSKNAALPIIFATIITRGISVLSRVPDILDVRVALRMIENLGAVTWRAGDRLYIDTRSLVYRDPDESLTSKIRGSTYILGASLARFGKCALPGFGGCNFAKRPIDLHIFAAECFGAVENDGILSCERLVSSEVVFQKRSVGATANALIMAASVNGESVIRGHAREPHIMALVGFLRSAGAEIFVTDDEIRVFGGRLHGGECELIGDMIEAGSYLGAAIMTGGRVGVIGCDVADMGAYLAFLSSFGANIEISDGKITAERGSEPKYTQVTAAPYPEFPTDLQPIAAAVLSAGKGGKIYDRVFPNRFGYLDDLSAFGVKYDRGSGEAEMLPSQIHSGEAILPDLRGGAACLLCALAAESESRLYSPEVLLRGYEKPVEKLLSLGADIKFEQK